MTCEREPRFFDLVDVRHIGERLKRGLDLSVQLGFLLLLLLLVLGAWVSSRHTQRLYDTQSAVAHSHEVLAQVRSVLASTADAESAVRGWVITGSDDELAAFRTSLSALEGHLGELEQLVSDNERQRDLVKDLRQRSRLQVQHLNRVVDVGTSIDSENAAAIMRAGEGEKLMDATRVVIAELESTENRMLATRDGDARTSFRTAQITGVAVGCVGAILILLVYQMVRRFDHLRDKAGRDSADAHERFRVTLGSIGDAVIVTDAQGRLTFCNQACSEMLAATPDAMGKPLHELLSFVTESTGEPSMSVMDRARMTRRVARAPHDTALRLWNGRVVPVDATAATIFDRGGLEQGAVLIVRDVAERREHERQLVRSNDRFRALVLATAQVVWTTNAEGFVQEDSPAWRQLTGQTYEQWKGHGWLDAVHPDDREQVLKAWQTAVAATTPYQAEYRLRRADGSYHWMTVRAVPVFDLDGKVREWVGMNRDIQMRKETEDAEREASLRKDEFIALLAHELRNPLAPIRNAMEVLKTGAPEDTAHALAMMDRQLRHMVRLIDDLLDVSRISHGKLDLRLEHVDLRDVIRQTSEAARLECQLKQQHLFVSLPSTPMWVEGDPIRLAQVVTNLLNNAIKYSGFDASIWVTGEREGTRQLVTVRDTGQGIPTDMKLQIWDLFLQGGGRLERASGGLGIGLTLVKRLVEMHNGTVDAHSEGIGTGSEFQIRLPASSPPRDLGLIVRPASSFHALRPLRILVIDDNEDSAESLSMLMRIGGHTVRTVYRGESGLDEVRAFMPEVILCDIRMPGMSGFEFARQLRSFDSDASPFLVALTGFGTATDRAASLDAGFDRHLVKPVDPDSLASVLQDAARRRPVGERQTEAPRVENPEPRTESRGE